MSRLLKLAFVGGIGYALWKLLNDAGKEQEQPVARPAGTKPDGGGSSSSSPTKAELYERAQELGIEGRSKMSKQQLERAISDAG